MSTAADRPSEATGPTPPENDLDADLRTLISTIAMFASYIRCGDEFDSAAEQAKQRAREAYDRLASHLPSLLESQRDAERWRGLLASARIRVLGTAGIPAEGDGYAHMGIEIWTKHHSFENNPTPINADLLCQYADIMRANLTASPEDRR